MKILLIEDDIALAESLKIALNAQGYAVEWSQDGVDGQFMVEQESFAAVILDLGLPKRNGMQVLTNLRDSENKTPILILTARDSWRERLDGLKAGADDYLGKPFHQEELLARLEAVIRRHHGQSNNILRHQNIRLDTDSQQLTVGQHPPQLLTGIEYRLLRLLLIEPEKLHSKTLITEHIYEEQNFRDTNVVEVYINRLRQRFGKAIIQTQRGQGYKMGRGE